MHDEDDDDDEEEEDDRVCFSPMSPETVTFNNIGRLADSSSVSYGDDDDDDDSSNTAAAAVNISLPSWIRERVKGCVSVRPSLILESI